MGKCRRSKDTDIAGESSQALLRTCLWERFHQPGVVRGRKIRGFKDAIRIGPAVNLQYDQHADPGGTRFCSTIHRGVLQGSRSFFGKPMRHQLERKMTSFIFGQEISKVSRDLWRLRLEFWLVVWCRCQAQGHTMLTKETYLKRFL